MKDIFPCNLSFGDMCTIAKAAQYTQGGTRLQTEDLGNEVVAGALDDRIHPFVIGEVASVQINLRLSHACVDLPLEVFAAELANKRRGIFAFQKRGSYLLDQCGDLRIRQNRFIDRTHTKPVSCHLPILECSGGEGHLEV